MPCSDRAPLSLHSLLFSLKATSAQQWLLQLGERRYTSGTSWQPRTSANHFHCQDQLPAAAWCSNKDAGTSSQLASEQGQQVVPGEGSRTFVTKTPLHSLLYYFNLKLQGSVFHLSLYSTLVKNPPTKALYEVSQHLLSICRHGPHTPN